MLKFFAPLLGDAQLCLVFYTGKPKLSKSELVTISSHGNIIVRQQRPDLEQLLEQGPASRINVVTVAVLAVLAAATHMGKLVIRVAGDAAD